MVQPLGDSNEFETSRNKNLQVSCGPCGLFEARLSLAVRALAKTPGFTAIAVLVIAVGIGVNTAVFSVINAVLLKPLAYPNPQELVSLTNTGPQGSFPGASIPKFALWRQQTSKRASSSRLPHMILAGLDSTSPKVTARSRYRVFTYQQTILQCSVHPLSPDALLLPTKTAPMAVALQC